MSWNALDAHQLSGHVGLGGIESSSRSLIQKVMYRVEVMLKDLEKTIYNK